MALFSGWSDGSPSGPHYEIDVNKGSMRKQSFEAAANKRWANGYRIAHVYEQDGNTVVVWEKRNEG